MTKKDRKELLIWPHLLGLMCPPPESGEDAICPVVGRHVQPAEHLRGCNSLRVHAHLLVRRAAVRHGLHQGVDTARLAGTRRPQGHHAVTYVLRLVKLDQLEDPRVMVDETSLSHLSRWGRRREDWPENKNN